MARYETREEKAIREALASVDPSSWQVGDAEHGLECSESWAVARGDRRVAAALYREAVAAADRGEISAAVSCILEAAEIERGYGRDPTYGRAARVCREALERG